MLEPKDVQDEELAEAAGFLAVGIEHGMDDKDPNQKLSADKADFFR